MVILQGQRKDGTPLVLVRCSCGRFDWLMAEWCEVDAEFDCARCGRLGRVPAQLSLAEADVAYPEVQKEQLVA